MHTNHENNLFIHHLSHLPAYACYLQEHRLKEFAALQLQLCREWNVPLLTAFEHLSKEDLLSFFTNAAQKQLSALAQNDVRAYIDETVKKWARNRHFPIDQYTVTADDSTLLNFIRKKALTHFIPEYTNNSTQLLALIQELDEVLMLTERTATQERIGRLQQKLKDQSYLTTKIINTIPGLIYLFNLKTFSVDFVNESAEAFFNLSNEALKSMGDRVLALLIHPDDLPATIELLNGFATAEDGEVRLLEYRLRNNQGDYVWMRNYMSIFKRDAQGKPLLTIGNILNINAEKLTAEELLEAQEVAGMGSFDWDLVSKNTHVSDQLLKILEIEGLSDMQEFLALVHPADRDKLTQAIQAAIHHTGIYECEYRFMGREKEKVIWSRGKVHYQDNVPVKIKGTLIDVTERNQMLEQLRKSEELYKQAQALSHIGHFTLDLKTRRITFTEELNRIYELEPDQQEFDYDSITSMRDPEDNSNARERIKHTIKTKEPFNFYYKIITRKGTKKTLHALGRGIYDESGAIVQLVGTVQDVTERHQLVQRLQKSEWLYKQAEVLANMGNWNWDMKSNKLEWSDQLYKIYGLAPQSEEMTIDRFLSFVHPDDRTTIKEEIEKGYPHDYEDYTFRIIAHGGEEKILRSIAIVQRDANGNIISIIGSEQDITEHQRLVTQLQQNELLYMQAQALAHVGNWGWQVKKNTIMWSDELYRIYGLEPQSEPINYETYLSFLHPDDREAVQAKVQQALTTGEPWNIVHRIIWRDGSQHTVYATGEVVQHEQQEPVLLIGTSQDITQQQAYEKQLAEQQKFIQKIADATPSILAAYNIHTGQYVFINGAVRKLLGYEPESILQEGISFFIRLVHPDDLPKIMARNNEAIQHFNEPSYKEGNDVIVEFEYRMKHANGEWRWFHTFGTIFDRNSKGEIEHVLNISMDVTDRMQAEERLAEQEHFIKHIADASPTILYLFDVEQNCFVYINREIFFVLGYTTDEILHMGAAANQQLYHPEDFHLLPERQGSGKKFQQMGSMIQYECRMKHKNDSWRWLLVREIAFKTDESGRIQQVLGAALDINQRKEMERSLLYNAFQLEQSNASLEEFAYVASHDLKEPLRKISTFGDRLVTTQLDRLTPDGKIYLNKIVDASQRMQTMISDLLSISMISGNRSFENYSLQKILDDALQTLEYKIEQKNALIQSDPLPEANIIPSQFRQLFQNLLSNSLKFAKEEVQPVITITHRFLKPEELPEVKLSESPHYHKIEFIDNGIGFENEFAGKIFAIFQRLHGRSEYEGTGIGLAICKKIVEHHGGVIYASGVPDKGATFTIILPA